MTYGVGVDLGTSFTAAAVFDSGRASIVDLGQRRPQIPTVVYVAPDGSVAVGDAADRRAVNEPARVVREFKRRLGDQVGSLVGSQLWSAESLMAEVLSQVIADVTRLQGGPPGPVMLTHPANWGPYKLDLMGEVARLAGLHDVGFVAEPVAAAVHHAHHQRVRSGQVYLVFDLGGGTFDATVVRVDDARPAGDAPAGRLVRGTVIGEPGGLERVGGVDFDEAVRGLVERLIGTRLDCFDTTDPRVLHGLAQLRDDIVSAKEALSVETHVEVPLFLPGVPPVVRLSRAEFEAAIRPRVLDTVAAAEMVLDSARGELNDAEAVRVLLVGGSSRVPLVAQAVTGMLGLPVALDEHPKHAVALGAARLAAAGRPELFALAHRPAGHHTGARRPSVDAGDLDADERGGVERQPGRFDALAQRLGLTEVDDADTGAEVDSISARWGEERRRVSVTLLPMEAAEAGPISAGWHGALTTIPRHPSLVATYRVVPLEPGEWPGANTGRVAVAEHPRGRSLAAELAVRGAPSVADVVAIGVQVAGALATLHRRRLVHGALDELAVIVTAWERSPLVKVGRLGGATTASGYGDDIRALGSLVHRLLCGADPPSTLDGDRLRRAGAAEGLIEAVRLLLSPGDGHEDAALEHVARLLRDVELAERRVPTEFSVVASEVSARQRPLRPVEQARVEEAQGFRSDESAGAGDQVPDAAMPLASPPSSPPGPPEVVPAPTRLRIVTNSDVKAGWGAVADRSQHLDDPRDRPLTGAEPEWVATACRVGDAAGSSPGPQRVAGGGIGLVVSRWIIPVLMALLLLGSVVLLVVER